MQEIVILGANGNCIDIAETVEAVDGMTMLGFLDDDPSWKSGSELAGYPILGRIADAGSFPHAKFVCGIGSPTSFRSKPDLIRRTGLRRESWATVVHPSCVVSRYARLGPGTVLLPHSVIGARASIGAFCMILQGSIVSHDCVVADFCILASGVCLSGACEIGTNTYIGSRAAIRNGLRVGSQALVGMGAVVVKDVDSATTVCGNPARICP